MTDAPAWNSLSFALTYATAVIVATFGAVLVAPLGLVVSGGAVWLLEIVFGTYLGAIAAIWVANVTVRDHSRSNVTRIVLTALAVGAVVGLGSLAIFDGPSPRLYNLPITLLVFMAVTSFAVTIAVEMLRSPERPVRRDIALTIGLVVGGFLGVVVAVTVICAAGGCGA